MDDALPDERLSLIFACCHPALSLESQVALTLRLVGGLTTEEIARAFLVPEPTMAQRLSRAKGKVRAAAIPIRVPPRRTCCSTGSAPVHAVLYLAFNQGYGPPPTRRPARRGDPAREAPGRADARRRGVARARRADAPPRRPAGDARRRERRDRAPREPGPSALGPRTASTRGGGCSTERSGSDGPGRTRSRRRSPRSTRTSRPTGARSRRSTDAWSSSRRPRWSS